MKPRKIDQYLADGNRLRDAVAAYRAQRDEAGAEVPVTPTPTKRKSWPLPPLERPTEIPGFPTNPSPPRLDLPDYGSIGRLKAIRAAQADRRGKRAPLTPSGPSRLVKRGSQ